MKPIEICCMFCDQNILSLDPGFTLPLRGQMMTPAGIARNDGNWQYPYGPITTDFICPMCGGFPWGYDDGNLTSRVKALAVSVPAGIEATVTETRGVVSIDLMDVILARGVNGLLGEPTITETPKDEEKPKEARKEAVKKEISGKGGGKRSVGKRGSKPARRPNKGS